MDNVTVNASTHPYWDFPARHGWTYTYEPDENKHGHMIDLYRPDGTWYSGGSIWTPEPDAPEDEIEECLAQSIVEEQYGNNLV